MIIDRIEGGYAVAECEENGVVSHINIALCIFPDGVNEGDVIFERDGLCYTDREATERRRVEAIEKLRRIGEEGNAL